ncbi:MAG: helix-turn-helix domain-containing protein, partial [Conexivisphaerales archaeon]|nr:helix-turn-helix domain-containing protein [Conexivisphaerales archaeon]
MEMERLYTLKEAKRLLGVTTRTIQRWDKDGKIRVVRTVGGRRRIPESE